MKIELKVKGMKCEGCEKRICNALKLVEGVKSVQASHTDSAVTVDANENVKETLIQKIEDLGFEVENK